MAERRQSLGSVHRCGRKSFASVLAVESLVASVQRLHGVARSWKTSLARGELEVNDPQITSMSRTIDDVDPTKWLLQFADDNNTVQVYLRRDEVEHLIETLQDLLAKSYVAAN